MITRQEYLGNRMSAILWRPRVAGRGQPALPERVAERALVVAHRAGEQAHGGIDDGERSGLAAAQNEVAERELLRGEMIGDTLVDVLVVSAQDGELRRAREAH